MDLDLSLERSLSPKFARRRFDSADEDAQSGPLLLICMFVFCSQFQPAEPFLVDYLVDNVGLSTYQVFGEVMNLYIYARLPCIMLVGVLSEVPGCSSRHVLLAGAAFSLATNLLTYSGTTLLAQQLAEFTVAAAMASRIAVMGLVFSVSLSQQFQSCVHMVHATLLFSNFSSAVLGEVLRDNVGVSLSRLLEISIFSQAVALLCALQLPTRRPDCPGSHDFGMEGEEPTVAPARSLRRLKDPLVDLCLSLRLRVVAWWTVWALVMNPAHTLTLTYWQSLVRSKHFGIDYNGYALASMYLVAGLLVTVSRHAAPLRNLTSGLVISSMLVAGLILSQVISSSREVLLYVWLLAFQCVFHLGTAASIFQVGSEVMHAAKASSPQIPGFCCRPAVPRVARLTLLFSVTGVLSSINENIIQIVINSFHSIEIRLEHLCGILAVVPFLLTLVWAVETLVSRNAKESHVTANTSDAQHSALPLGKNATSVTAPLLSAE